MLFLYNFVVNIVIILKAKFDVAPIVIRYRVTEAKLRDFGLVACAIIQ